MIQHGFPGSFRRPQVALLSGVALSLCLPQLATAQTVAEPVPVDAPALTPDTSDTATARTTAYPAAFFAAFAPATALDIVRRVPGFTIEQTDGEVRGFGAAAGNVVFNGARPSSKSDGLETILARIPASRVLRVEIAPGDLFGSDYAGKAQVLNVILTAGGGIDGNVTVKAGRNFSGRITPNAEASVLIRRGASSINLAADSGRFETTEEGFDRLVAVPGGNQLEFRDKVNTIRETNPFVSASWGMELAPDRAVHLNARYARGRFRLTQTNRVTPANGPMRDDRLFQDHEFTGYELGGDVTRPLAGGAIKLVALANRRDRENFDTNLNRLPDPTNGTQTGGTQAGGTQAGGARIIGGFEQFTMSRYDEAVGRLSWNRANLLGLTFELGGELAYNRLENATELLLLDGAGGRTRIDLPIDQAVVDELRTETYVNAGKQLSPALRLDGALAFETSRLAVSGDAAEQRSLRFLKPSLTLDWKPGGAWRVQVIARREVAQLDFFDFISNAELASDRVNGSNAELQPQRSWEARATIEHPLLVKGLAKLELGYDRVSLLQDRVLTDGGFDAPGNIGTGTRQFAKLNLDAPLDRLGLANVQLRSEATVQKTSVRDPLSGQRRAFSGFWPEWRWLVELRRDKGPLSFGATLQDRAKFGFFRTDEIDRNFNDKPFMNAFAEYRPDPKTTLRLDFDNVLQTAGQRSRQFFDPNRSAPLPVADEFRDRNSHIAVTFSIRRGFGGGGAKAG